MDIVAPPRESSPVVEILLIFCFLGFAVCAIINGVAGLYFVALLATLFGLVFAGMFFVSKGVGRQ